MRYFLFIVVAFYVNIAAGRDIKGRFKLQRIDSSVFADHGYYLLEFKKRSTRYIFLSKKNNPEHGELIQIGKRYKLKATERHYYTIAGGLDVLLNGRGLVVDGRRILETGEPFYHTTCISGLFFVCRKNK